jgi:thymidine phosphorylase
LIEAQGGDPRVIDDPTILPIADRVEGPRASRSGVITAIDSRAIGMASVLLGAGRARVDSSIDPGVGVLLRRKVGDAVAAGEPFCDVLARDRRGLDEANALIAGAFEVGDGPAEVVDLILERL